jgi:multidrug efflux pump
MAYFTMAGRQYQVIGQYDYKDRDGPLDLSMVQVKNNRGDLIRIDNFVKFKEVSNPPQIFHYNRYKSVMISAAPAPGYTIADGNAEMLKIADEVLEESFATEFAGQSRDFEESASNTNFAFLFALILVYLILAAQFESFTSPLVIMITVPLAIAGAILTLWIFDQTLNIFSQIGIIMLLGLVTKNGILIVEFANQLRVKKGLSVADAVREASILRLRPILMTTFATILGALPIALALGAGAESRKPLGLVVVGGLAFSLILTLYIIPVIYTYFNKDSNETQN